MNAALNEIAELIHSESGFRVPSGRQAAAISRALATATPDLDAEAFMGNVTRDGDSLARLVDEITVKETYFCRDERQLRTIDWRTLAAHARDRGSDAIDVWTAGCATGEEPYSLALHALETFGTANPPVRILATDISRTALDHARQGCYRERSVRLLPQWQRSLHFEQGANGTTTIGDSVRRLVRFERHNLVRDPVPAPGVGGFDLVLCRNVLIYFDTPTVVAVLDRLRRALRPEGVLVLGVADALCLTAVTLAELEQRPKQRRHVLTVKRPKPPRKPPVIAAPEPGDRGADAASSFVAGLVELERGQPETAVAMLRRALFLEPSLAVAAFQLGRAHEAAGDRVAAVRAYEQTLRTLVEHPQSDSLLEQIDPADVASACGHRIAALA